MHSSNRKILRTRILDEYDQKASKFRDLSYKYIYDFMRKTGELQEKMGENSSGDVWLSLNTEYYIYIICLISTHSLEIKALTGW